MGQLPPGSDRLVAFDTETSGLYEDDGARISVVSAAWRDEQGNLIYKAWPFDQGIGGSIAGTGELPLGPKKLPSNHEKRIKRWEKNHPERTPEELYTAPNLLPQHFGELTAWLARQWLICHNSKFDLLKMDRGLRGQEGMAPELGGGRNLVSQFEWDTQIAQHVLEPVFGSSLKPTAVRYHLGAELGIDEGSENEEQEALDPWKGPKTDPRFDLIPWFVMEKYAALDPALTLLLYERQQEMITDPEFEREIIHIYREFDLMKVLYGMERRGIGFDAERCLNNAAILKKKRAEIERELPFKATLPSAKAYFFGPEEDGNLGLPPFNDKMTKPSKTHPNGQPQLDDEVTARLVKRDIPWAKQWEEYASLGSALGKWYDAWPHMVGKDGRLRTCHRQTKVVSGRLSVERVQLHAIPHDYQISPIVDPVRRFFRPAPGHEIWELDMSQAEIRIATAVAEEVGMLKAFRRGDDSHSAACKLMFRSVFEADGFVGHEEDHPKWDEYRQVAKRCNLGILYGAGADTIREQIKKFTGIEYPRNQVQKWVSDWKQTFPAFVRMMETNARIAERRGYVRLVNGRLRYFSEYEPTHKAGNQVIQGSLAETMKDCMIRTDAEFPGILLLQIHDSQVLELPADRAKEIVSDVRQIMQETFEKTFTKTWKASQGKRVIVPFRADVKRWEVEASA